MPGVGLLDAGGLSSAESGRFEEAVEAFRAGPMRTQTEKDWKQLVKSMKK